MKKSNSNLLNYIGLLLSDDQALQTFLIDPITEPETIHGITKAERSVLRRTIANLSNKSVNGFTISRHLGSYKRSLRLLQNVLHNVGSKMVQDVMLAQIKEEEAVAIYTFSIVYNLPNGTSSGPVDFTCKTNAYVNQNFGGPYAFSFPPLTVKLSNPYPTIKQVMDEVNRVYFGYMPYTTVMIGGDEYIKSLIPLSTYEIKADISSPCYDLSKNPNADYVFWFYSLNGRANPNNSGGIGTSFADVNLKPNDTVFWQLIAPDREYGFQKCSVTEGNAYAAE